MQPPERPSLTVDEFVEGKVLPELQPIVAAIRSLMREHAPNAREAIGYGMTVYKGNKVFAWINSTKKDVTLGFSRGTQMEDSYGLLSGAGKGSRHVKMRNLDEVNRPALACYIKQAVKLDER